MKMTFKEIRNFIEEKEQEQEEEKSFVEKCNEIISDCLNSFNMYKLFYVLNCDENLKRAQEIKCEKLNFKEECKCDSDKDEYTASKLLDIFYKNNEHNDDYFIETIINFIKNTIKMHHLMK